MENLAQADQLWAQANVIEIANWTNETGTYG